MSNQATADAALLSSAALSALLELAQASIVASVEGRALPAVPGQLELAWPRGVFVSLHRKGELRGCLGHLEADVPVGEATRRMAVAAARDDPRFLPVTPDELADLDVEVSVLSPFERIRPEDVVPGRDGLLIRRGMRSGVLLPQVATEHHWDRLTFLRAVCQKAALPAEAWKDPTIELWAFQAQVVPPGQRT